MLLIRIFPSTIQRKPEGTDKSSDKFINYEKVEKFKKLEHRQNCHLVF